MVPRHHKDAKSGLVKRIFLREQIALNPRGPEWLALLKARLARLEPFVGRPILTGIFHSNPHSAILRIDPDTNRLIQMEVI